MKVSQFDSVTSHINRLRALRDARDAARYETIYVSSGVKGNEHDIKELTSINECRSAICDVIDRHISTVLQELKAYGVDDE